jgi:TRAP-type C4-dicarboxylate transport system permease small subunit
MTAIGRLMARAIGLTTIVGMIAVAVMMLHISADVVGKFLFNAPIPATISLVSHYYMAEVRNGHITVEVLTELFPRHTQRHLYSWTYLLSATIFGLLTYRTWNEALTTRENGAFIMEQSTKIITWPSYYLLPIGFGLMTVVVVYRFIVYASGAHSGLGETPLIDQTAKH